MRKLFINGNRVSQIIFEDGRSTKIEELEIDEIAIVGFQKVDFVDSSKNTSIIQGKNIISGAKIEIKGGGNFHLGDE